jgi:hypothetical protein
MISTKRFFVGQGYDVPVTNMFDVNGDEVLDPKNAHSVVAQLPDGRWLAAKVAPHEIVERPLS